MKSLNKIALAVGSFALLTLTGCATIGNQSPATEKEVTFPAIEKAVFSSNNYKGSWPNWSNVAQVEHGMTKDQLYALLSYPHYREGLYGAREWNYIFNYRTAENEHRQCQYQIHFDKNMTTQAMYWSSPECEKQVKNITKPTQQVINNIIQQMPEAKPVETLALSADALFAFDKFSLSDVNPQGRQELANLVQRLKHYEQTGKISVYIVGHTDRFGGEAYNMNLSKKRADSIAAYLLSSGIKPANLHTLGAGEHMPVKECSISGTKQQQIDCLQPNRRVEVQIYVAQ
ncbi:hypothetical protein MOVS_02430 [Moraxella ovis]|uniref:Outer membrane protein II n=1 Tax=Moraxella ovis TaxID=29433 RepID=A0A378PIC1_9GAMM|nr:OmpA family protein [Moraxella ovis]ANB91031.1 hypothetical protein MOVS_02430 [Moraxella ovis]STY86523.1 Outer membrane protein II* [Moraxella ovis]